MDPLEPGGSLELDVQSHTFGQETWPSETEELFGPPLARGKEWTQRDGETSFEKLLFHREEKRATERETEREREVRIVC